MSYNNYPKADWGNILTTDIPENRASVRQGIKKCPPENPNNTKAQILLTLESKLIEDDTFRDDDLGKSTISVYLNVGKNSICFYSKYLNYQGNFPYFESEGVLFDFELMANNNGRKTYRAYFLKFAKFSKETDVTSIEEKKTDVSFGVKGAAYANASFKGRLSAELGLTQEIEVKDNAHFFQKTKVGFKKDEVVSESFEFFITLIPQNGTDTSPKTSLKKLVRLGAKDRDNMAIITDYNDKLDGSDNEDVGEIYFNTDWKFETIEY